MHVLRVTAILEFKISYNTQELFSRLVFNDSLYGIVALKEWEKDRSVDCIKKVTYWRCQSSDGRTC